MRKILSLIITSVANLYMVQAQTKAVTVDANDVLNNNTKLVSQTSVGQVFFTGHQLGAGYYYPAGIFRAITDNSNNAANYYFDGITNGATNFSVRADGQGYFAGNLGIGNVNPDAKLTVFASSPLGGAAKNAVLISSVGGPSGSNYFKNNIWLVRNAAGTDWLTARLHDGISIDVSFLNPQTNTRTWWERDPYQDIQSWGTSANTYMAIVQGNVAIGTLDSKGYKLAVNGGVIATAVTVKAYPWPDFVFKKDYRLLPLQDVKRYINKYQHLPEIPSAEQVSKQGLDLGEMNRLLVRKVEELTLYLIQEHKENKQQQRQINRLNKRLSALSGHGKTGN
ncbi:hypothetical protein SNE26_07325 [Mucilaginibacter sp. cycad4]|uniref:hypothetical protein n=1 Tax=Mucilaginibacter sp. cycad4 TaxID=3342096 RepID=UPI002AAAB7E2|nr:hypothetical protein [Mucilaginibacter gossypii]WPV01583.1 hypothetical protein SNE26_07325 [Mucilaginibacter gossypii]